MARERTKALTQAVKELNEKQVEEMKALEAEREEALKQEQHDEAAQELHNAYMSYIKAGFTEEEQAWEIVKILVTNGTRKTLF